MRKIVVFTGAGVSAESGINTFRGSGGLWEGYRVTDVATPEAWIKDPEMVQRFYNQRRKQCLEVQPNAAHRLLAAWAEVEDVHIITQNIDDLHERAGSRRVLHLHGEIRKAQSSKDASLIYPVEGPDILMGELCERGTQLRPHVVWFGEAVPNLQTAAQITQQADVFIVIGTSLQVYPAANLLYETKAACQVFLIDPQADEMSLPAAVQRISQTASEGLQIVRDKLAK